MESLQHAGTVLMTKNLGISFGFIKSFWSIRILLHSVTQHLDFSSHAKWGRIYWVTSSFCSQGDRSRVQGRSPLERVAQSVITFILLPPFSIGSASHEGLPSMYRFRTVVHSDISIFMDFGVLLIRPANEKTMYCHNYHELLMCLQLDVIKSELGIAWGVSNGLCRGLLSKESISVTIMNHESSCPNVIFLVQRLILFDPRLMRMSL